MISQNVVEEFTHIYIFVIVVFLSCHNKYLIHHLYPVL